jgi:hypothetical protein
MAICKNCKCESKYCGCADKATPVSPPCGQDTLYCPRPEPCPETFAAECVVYTGDSIDDLGIEKGDRMDLILQILTLWITNPTCINGTGVCSSPLGLESTYISNNTIKIAWLPVTGVGSYYVQFKVATSGTWTTYGPLTPTANPEYILPGLVQNTLYNVRVYSACPNPPPGSGTSICNSVTLSIRTLPNP